MISIGIVKSSSDTSKYFLDKDNYYLSDKSEIAEAARWLGDGARRLDILGTQIEPKLFDDLLNGRMPNGEQIGKMRDGSIRHRPATDLTFSANKSYSIMALVAGDERLIALHNRAVELVLGKIETMYAEARKTVGGMTEFEQTKNLIIAAFRHTTSRELDPQLHTHGVIINATQREDGQWRALSSRQKSDIEHFENGFRENIYNNQHYLGMLYNSILAKGAVECGYDIEVVDKHGNFKIIDVPDAYIEDQSKRRAQIEKMLAERGEKGAKAAQMATLASRLKKMQVDPEALKKTWQKGAVKQGVDLEAIVQKSKEHLAQGNNGKQTVNTAMPVISQDVTSAVEDAIAHLSQYSVSLSHGDIIRQAFVFGGGSIEHEAIEHSVAKKIEEGELIGKANIRYTTAALVEKERAFKQTIAEIKGKAWSLDIGRSGILGKVLASTDRIQLVEVNGVKREAALVDGMVKGAEKAGLNAYVLHQNASSINRLRGDIEREQKSFWSAFKNFFAHDLMQTVSHFKHEYSHKIAGKILGSSRDDVIFVLDAQKLSYQDVLDLNTLAEQRDAKVVMLNNNQETTGFTPGNPMMGVRDGGVAHHVSRTPKVKGRVNIVETKMADRMLARSYLEDQGATPVVVKTNKDQEQVTAHIRAALRDEGQLGQRSFRFEVLSTRGLSDAQKGHSKFYGVGDQITFHAFSPDQETWRVAKVDCKANILLLHNKQGDARQLDLSAYKETGHEVDPFEVKKAASLDIAVGEKLRANRNLYLGDHRIDKNATFSVSSITQEGIRIIHEGHSLWLDQERLKQSFVEHGYVIKPHQLTDSKKVITKLSGYQVSRQSMGELREYAPNITLITDNAAKTKKLLDHEQINWVASDIAHGKANYDPIVRTDAAIRKDLETVAKALLGEDKDKVATALSYGLSKLAEREAAFSIEDVVTESVRFAIGKVDALAIEQLIDAKRESGELLGERLLTTQKVFDLEKSIIKNNLQGRGKITPVMDITGNLPAFLTKGQREAVTLALTTKDRFIGIEGLAGTGKTTMMKALKDKAEVQGYKIIGVAPTHKAVQKLDASLNNREVSNRFERAGIEVMTAHSFLNKDTNDINPKTIFIADESSMLGNRLFHDIQNKVIASEAQGIFLGDTKQQVAIDQGKPMELSIKYGLKTAQMKEIVRQMEAPVLKQGIEQASQTHAKASLNTIAKINPQEIIKRSENSRGLAGIDVASGSTSSFIEVPPDRDKEGNMIFTEKGVPQIEGLYEAVASDYLSRIPEQRDRTLVIATMHESREAITHHIREGLKQEGIITNEMPVTRLKSKNMDQAEMLSSKNFKEGDVLKFDGSYSVAKRGDHMVVQDIDTTKNQLTLSDTATNNTYRVNPALIADKAQMSVFSRVKTKLGDGDRIRLRVSDSKRGLKGGDEYVISHIDEKGIATIKNADTILDLDLSKQCDQHWDHGYTNTTFSVQGDDDRLAIGVAINENYRTNYIQLSRAKTQATIYTPDKARLFSSLDDLIKADKHSAIETLERAQQKSHQGQQTQKGGVESNPRKEDTFGKEKTDGVIYRYQEKPISADDILPQLNSRIEELAIRLLGEPNRKLSKPTQLRYGRNGSMAIDTSNGLWNSFEEGKGGNAFDLIKRELGITDFKEVLEFAKGFVGYQADSEFVPIKPKVHQKETAKNKHDSKSDYAQQLVSQSQPLTGTAGEQYLHNRGLFNIGQSDVRYIRSLHATTNSGNKTQTPAIIAYTRSEQGKVNNAQVIRITPDGQKNLNVSIRKQTYGAINGRAVILNHQADKSVTYLVEGPETGFAILAANKKAHVLAVLGKSNFKTIDLEQLAGKVVLCLDNDGIKTFTEEAIKDAVARIEQSGRQVHLIMPEWHKQDFNDVLQQQGHQALSNQVKKLITPQEFKAIEEGQIKAHASANGKIDISKALNTMRINNPTGTLFDNALTKAEQQAVKNAQTQDAKFSAYGDMLNSKAFTEQVQAYKNSKANSLKETDSKALDQQISNDQIDNVVDRVSRQKTL